VDYFNTPLPASNLPYYSVAAFWDDLFITGGTSGGIFYTITGVAPARTVAFEWYLQQNIGGNPYYRFGLSFDEGGSGFIRFQYDEVPDLGQGATVGLQGRTGKLPVPQ
jgi:hypothetical protein